MGCCDAETKVRSVQALRLVLEADWNLASTRMIFCLACLVLPWVRLVCLVCTVKQGCLNGAECRQGQSDKVIQIHRLQLSADHRRKPGIAIAAPVENSIGVSVTWLNFRRLRRVCWKKGFPMYNQSEVNGAASSVRRAHRSNSHDPPDVAYLAISACFTVSCFYMRFIALSF